MSGYVVPNVVNRTPRGDRVTDVYSRLLEERIVYLGTELDDGVANALVAQVLHLDAEEILAVRGELEEALSRHTGQDVATLRRDTDRDRILRAQEAVDYGLADVVIRSRDGD